MAVTKAPSVEAMEALVERINTGSEYQYDVTADYSDYLTDEHESINDLRVDVVHESEQQLSDTLDVEDRTSHQIRVWIRKRISEVNQESVDNLKLYVRQLYQRLNDYDTSDNRVQVWEIDADQNENPNKALLREAGLFVASLMLRVEVAASA